jgi:hypothetical protein
MPIPSDNEVRLAVYRHFVDNGRAPSSADLAQSLQTGASEIRRSFERLSDAHILVLDPDTRELRMAMPFSAVPTGYRVMRGQESWWAN